jgi:hypothetical protein
MRQICKINGQVITATSIPEYEANTNTVVAEDPFSNRKGK